MISFLLFELILGTTQTFTLACLWALSCHVVFQQGLHWLLGLSFVLSDSKMASSQWPKLL